MQGEEFSDFAREVWPRLMRVARVLSRNEHDAADLVQDCLVRMGTRWSRLDHSDDLYGYAHKTLVRLNIDRFRRFRREVLTSSVNEPSHVPGSEVDLDWLGPAWRDLSPLQRTTVGLRYFDDASVEQIADLLAVSQSTVRSHISRGLARLRQSAPTSTRLGNGAKHG